LATVVLLAFRISEWKKSSKRQQPIAANGDTNFNEDECRKWKNEKSTKYRAPEDDVLLTTECHRRSTRSISKRVNRCKTGSALKKKIISECVIKKHIGGKEGAVVFILLPL